MAIIQELFELGKAVSEALNRARDPTLIDSLHALEQVCETAKRAWSGSNMGYHAKIYYDGLVPAPPGAEFNPEWGLLDSWPVHQPDPGWRVMDPGDVVGLLLARANINDLPAIKQAMKASRDCLSTLKEQAVSMLITAPRPYADEFVKRQLGYVKSLEVAAPDLIAPTLVRGGQWTRDSEAHSQGMTVAPHQRMVAVYLSHRVTLNGLNTLQNAVMVSATHIQRLARMDTRDKSVGNSVVIGHGRSTAWRDLRDFIKDRLKLPHDEFNRVPVAGVPNTVRLTQMLDGAAFAFIVLTGEDEQADGTIHARQNAVHEAGLFQGRLGFTKAIVMLEDGCGEFSNIVGLGQIRFPKGNIAAAFEEVRKVLEREGIIEP
jgi:predicted nucleotide-binding protein